MDFSKRDEDGFVFALHMDVNLKGGEFA